MYAVSTSQIADILHFNDKISYRTDYYRRKFSVVNKWNKLDS